MLYFRLHANRWSLICKTSMTAVAHVFIPYVYSAFLAFDRIIRALSVDPFQFCFYCSSGGKRTRESVKALSPPK